MPEAVGFRAEARRIGQPICEHRLSLQPAHPEHFVNKQPKPQGLPKKEWLNPPAAKPAAPDCTSSAIAVASSVGSPTLGGQYADWVLLIGLRQLYLPSLPEPSVMFAEDSKFACLALHCRMPHMRRIYGYHEVDTIVLLQHGESTCVFRARRRNGRIRG